ncbi:hypothetical protein ACP70R_002928 [Stipagrostis hirtigluma subsp. patula]
MTSSSAARRRRRNKPAPPSPHPPAAEHSRARPASAPRDAPPAAVRELGRATPPNPSRPEPQPRPAMLPASFTSAASLRHRLRHGRSQEEEAEEEARDWAALPLGAISTVLRKLDHVEILMGPGQVCRSWRCAARDIPALWRRIDMRGHADLERRLDLYGMAQVAIRRASGQCEAFWFEYAADDGLLRFLADQDILEFEEEIKKFPLLEELEISLIKNVGGTRVFEEIGRSCPELKHFRFNQCRFYDLEDSEDTEDDDDSEFKYSKDDDALGIASMHGLRSLQLFGNNFTNKGLTAILDNCPYLESLDIRHCFNIVMDNALRAKCARIKTLKLPYDSTDDYEFEVMDVTAVEEARDWAALPLDTISAVLRRLDHVEILMGPGQVCRSWRRAARDDPALWRHIDMRGHADLERRLDLYGMAQVAIRRAAGQCEAFWLEYVADDGLLRFLADQ